MNPRAAIPLSLTALRAALAPVVVALAILRPDHFLLGACLAVAFLSDVFDGIIARRLGVATPALRRFDSMTDTVFYVAVGFAIWHLHPDAVRPHFAALLVFIALEATRYVFDFVKFRREAAYHAWSAKLWGIFLFAGCVGLLVFDVEGLPVALAIYFGIVSNIEGLVISMVLRDWKSDVPSLVHALRIRAATAAVICAIVAGACSRAGAAREGALPETGTFSIIAYDSASGEWGGAVQSRVFSVGNGVLSAEAGVGVVATQAVVDVSYGPQALALLRQGKSASEVVKYVWEHDPDPDTARWAKTGRQFAVVDAKGNVAAYTGPTAPTAAGDKQGAHVTAQGNTLADKAVPDSMVAAFNRTKGHLAFRLLAGIEAGQAAGGDKRGMQSAAMIIVKKCGGVWLHNDVVLKLQVDDSPLPIAELRRLVEKAPLPPRGITNARNDPACR
jgi:uncharacterized Ntn-hydrolase superfamily protein/phosphatidylglycerophosphate synthase